MGYWLIGKDGIIGTNDSWRNGAIEASAPASDRFRLCDLGRYREALPGIYHDRSAPSGFDIPPFSSAVPPRPSRERPSQKVRGQSPYIPWQGRQTPSPGCGGPRRKEPPGTGEGRTPQQRCCVYCRRRPVGRQEGVPSTRRWPRGSSGHATRLPSRRCCLATCHAPRVRRVISFSKGSRSAAIRMTYS